MDEQTTRILDDPRSQNAIALGQEAIDRFAADAVGGAQAADDAARFGARTLSRDDRLACADAMNADPHTARVATEFLDARRRQSIRFAQEQAARAVGGFATTAEYLQAVEDRRAGRMSSHEFARRLVATDDAVVNAAAFGGSAL